MSAQPDPPFSDSIRSPLPPPRYSLRTLLLIVTCIAMLLGLTWWVSPIVIAATVFLLLTVAAHVAGNAIGTHLRNGGSSTTEIPARLPMQLVQNQEQVAGSASPGPLPATHLGERWSLGRFVIIPTALGTLCSMIAGCVWMRVIYHGGIDVYGTVLAAAAFAVLGGFAAFGLTTFLQVTAVALWQALNHK